MKINPQRDIDVIDIDEYEGDSETMIESGVENKYQLKIKREMIKEATEMLFGTLEASTDSDNEYDSISDKNPTDDVLPVTLWQHTKENTKVNVGVCKGKSINAMVKLKHKRLHSMGIPGREKIQLKSSNQRLANESKSTAQTDIISLQNQETNRETQPIVTDPSPGMNYQTINAPTSSGHKNQIQASTMKTPVRI